MTRFTYVLTFAAVVSLPLGAQTGSVSTVYDPIFLSPLTWRNIGPNRAGRALDAAGSPSRLLEYYAGQAGGGLWKTTDGGTSWNPVTDGQIKTASVNAVAVSESNPDVVYIGMGESEVQRDMLQGDGVYKSSDAGKTWVHLGFEQTPVIAKIRIHPRDPDLVYVAAFGDFYGPSEQRGVYRSKDGGKSWDRILFRDNRSGAIDLAMDRANPNILFASVYQYTVTPGGSSGGPGGGFFKSTNGGDTWTEITRNPGLPKAMVGKIGMAISGADPNRIYALIEADDGGLFRSDDGGATWTRVNDEPLIRQRPSYFNRVFADPNDKDVLYVPNLPFLKSTDGGRSFQVMQSFHQRGCEGCMSPHGDHHDLWIAPNDSRRMIDSNDGGPTVTTNGGATWTAQAFPTAQIYRVATTGGVAYDVCGSQQDETAICVPSIESPWRTVSIYMTGAGGLGGPIYAPGSGEFGMLAPDPRNPDVIFGTGPSVISRYDRLTGLSTTRDVQVRPGGGRGADQERFSLYGLAWSHQNPSVLYTASQHLWRTANGGLKWESISPDLSRTGTPGAGGRGGGAIFAVAPSYHDSSTIWVGTNDGLVHVTRDGGKHWQQITPPNLPEASRINLIQASPSRPGTAYVVVLRFEYQDRSPYIFKTEDFGKTWKKIVGGIPSNDFVYAVREDPRRQGLLFAGTEHGVFVSFDDGTSWQSLSLNLPDTPVPDLVVEKNDLVIATHGRSFYVLDDIEPLRELSPQVTASALHLFHPRDAVRRLSEAVIDYSLRAPASQVIIEILDATGKVIRTFGGAEEGLGKTQPRQSFGEEDSSEPPRRAGLNRFAWDLRYANPTILPFMAMTVAAAPPPNGPIAAPGNYQVRVTANGETQTQPFKVVRDPRVPNLTDADLQAQFALSLKLRDAISTGNEGTLLIRSVRKQAQDRIASAMDGQITSQGQSLIATLSEIERNMPSTRMASVKLSLETGDGRPTAQHQEAFQKLKADLDVELGKLHEAMNTEVPRFNKLLAEHKLEPVRASQ